MNVIEPTWKGTARIGQRDVVLETGRIARQADGAVLIRSGGTALLVTVVAASAPREGTDFFPLTVEYKERFSSAGGFPGGYRKREGRANDFEILTCRLIDRSIRPLFPDGYRCEVQVIANVLAWEPDGDPESLAILGAAAALHLSPVPFDGPVAGYRVVQEMDDSVVAFPEGSPQTDRKMDLVLTIGPNGLVMAEGEAKEVSEDTVAKAIQVATDAAKPFFDLLAEARQALGIVPREFQADEMDTAVLGDVQREATTPSGNTAGPDAPSSGDEATVSLRDAVLTTGKHEKSAAVKAVRNRVHAALAETYPERGREIDDAFHAVEKKLLRRLASEEGLRIDGRNSTQIRPISIETTVLPRVHGSALFTRGETQALVVTTLGSARDEQEVERLHGVERQRFQLYYSFPPYSVGETRPLRGPGRREIGHGNLALRALAQVLPDPKDFPYTIKVESEITESNGSSSMATVCGGCLALMDAGVPITRPVAGIAMGLISDGDETVILSDILGNEDHLGDMDFKVAGTTRGITAIQLDNKLGSLPADLLSRALAQAKEGRLFILGQMAEALAEPRPQISANAPRIQSLTIGTHRIRTLIGAGGKTIRELQADTGTSVDVSDDGTVRVFAPDVDALRAAEKRIKELTGEPEVGQYYRGPVTGIANFGAFVRLFEGIEGMIHVSELSDERVANVDSVLSEGQVVTVKVLGTERGRIQLSLKAAKGVDESDIANL
ncbi:MAG: polyribonucleotide nucleotidyltransferase [Candidatus Eisenbacteria bacterium]|uniref:Polyribonucleotide nucleotidyltransferase n=1 Tax=Eiseniibacteriota bacterium TaxID=2212470 RepID=A0A956SCH7_UNCEI|nr:polyribonucleotide nucleotidyltransferase [Candidatus Eisenbacteria bacterium]